MSRGCKILASRPCGTRSTPQRHTESALPQVAQPSVCALSPCANTKALTRTLEHSRAHKSQRWENNLYCKVEKLTTLRSESQMRGSHLFIGSWPLHEWSGLCQMALIQRSKKLLHISRHSRGFSILIHTSSYKNRKEFSRTF